MQLIEIQDNFIIKDKVCLVSRIYSYFPGYGFHICLLDHTQLRVVKEELTELKNIRQNLLNKLTT